MVLADAVREVSGGTLYGPMPRSPELHLGMGPSWTACRLSRGSLCVTDHRQTFVDVSAGKAMVPLAVVAGAPLARRVSRRCDRNKDSVPEGCTHRHDPLQRCGPTCASPDARPS
jgi:hypothetical protein